MIKIQGYIPLFIGLLFTEANAQKPPIPRVNGVKVQEIPLCQNLEAIGTTYAKEAVAITANTTEKVEKVYFDDGQLVNADEILVDLEKDEEVSELFALEALLIEKKPSYERAKILVQKDVTAQAILETRLASLVELENQIKGVKAKINDRIIRAPFSGVLGFRQVSPGTLVETGDLITNIYDLSSIKVDFEVPSAYLATLKPGQMIRAKTEAYPDKWFHGKISSIDPQVALSTRSIKVRALIPNEEGLLKPGLLMVVHVAFPSQKTLVIPEEAVKKIKDTSMVHVIEQREGGRFFATSQSIEIGLRQAGMVAVIKGLKKGDTIVERGFLPLKGTHEVAMEGLRVYQPSEAAPLKCQSQP